MTEEQIVRANGVDICVQTFGRPADPTVLLIAGNASSMDFWESEFCERVAAADRFVVRYDHRDTGRSISYPPGTPGYSGHDLIADAVGVLDALDRPSANVVGISMGGILAQLLALGYPSRVGSLTLVSTSPGPGDADLSPMGADLPAGEPAPNWADRDAVTSYVTRDLRRYAAPSVDFDEEEAAAVAAASVARARIPESALTNHSLADSAGPWRDRLGQISCPTQVIHGTEDPLFPLDHGIALAAGIRGAHLITLDGVGHELPRRIWEAVIPPIVAISEAGWQRRADRLASAAIEAGEPTAWFERLYGGAVHGQSTMPWDRESANPLLSGWIAGRRPHDAGRRAVVVGCGLGADAEYLAALGFATTAFDIAASAIATARSRRPDSAVDYQVADARDLPAAWRRAFDLVVESFTVQALPDPPRQEVIAAVTELVADSGTLLVIALARSDDEAAPDGPPYPLRRAEIDAFAGDGLVLDRAELLHAAGMQAHWRAEFRRSAVADSSSPPAVAVEHQVSTVDIQGRLV